MLSFSWLQFHSECKKTFDLTFDLSFSDGDSLCSDDGKWENQATTAFLA